MTRDGSPVGSTDALAAAQTAYDAIRARGLKLNMQRGQPSDADFDLSNGLLTTLGEADLSMDGIDLRNYPAGWQDCPARGGCSPTTWTSSRKT